MDFSALLWIFQQKEQIYTQKLKKRAHFRHKFCTGYTVDVDNILQLFEEINFHRAALDKINFS